MTCDLVAVTVDALDPERLAHFWAGVLQRDIGDDRMTLAPGGRDIGDDGVTLAPGERDISRFDIFFASTAEPKTGPNRIHLDLTSTSADDQQATVERALALGGRYLDLGQGPEADHTVLADPEGNEFCVIEPGNGFLAGTGFIGAVNCEGTRRVGLFWSEALGWPLVWDQDEETAVQSPSGGSKLTWSGPPIPPKRGKSRIHLELRPAAGCDEATEVERLIALGATRVDIGQGAVGWTVLTDPDGTELCVLPAR
ncbi:MAG: VOC family protein [Phycicoccus sp.]